LKRFRGSKAVVAGVSPALFEESSCLYSTRLHFPRNELANPAEYLGERPEMTSHDGKPRKAKTMKEK
jgi:hypothetical protein